jgi:hypothetical protein
LLDAPDPEELHPVERQVYTQTQELLQAALGATTYAAEQASGAAWPPETSVSVSLALADEVIAAVARRSPQAVPHTPPPA